MAVEGHGGIAKQQGRRWCDRLAPVGWHLGCCAFKLGRVGFAVDDVLFLAHAQLAVLRVVVAHGDEQQGASAAVLLLDVQDGRQAMGFGSDGERGDELDPAPGPHAVTVIGRGQETAA